MWLTLGEFLRRVGFITFHGQDRALPADAYDLRATLAYLSRTTPGGGRRVENYILQDWDVDRAFAVSFSRAVPVSHSAGRAREACCGGREIRFVARS
jgi:hypothetical protein